MTMINTPCLVVDERKTLANIETMARRIAATGCAMRPHIKTQKSPPWAKLQALQALRSPKWARPR